MIASYCCLFSLIGALVCETNQNWYRLLLRDWRDANGIVGTALQNQKKKKKEEEEHIHYYIRSSSIVVVLLFFYHHIF